jgi:hypothetical protein
MALATLPIGVPVARNNSVAAYCTLALTDAAAFKVKMQDPVLLPPLEHAPDQIALLPFEIVRVMPVPCVNDAIMELPTGTLMPAGFEITLSPVRPVADTVSEAVVGGGAAGFSVSVPITVLPPAVANTDSAVDVATVDVGTEKLKV